MFRNLKFLLCIVCFALLGLTLARPDPQAPAKFVELEHTIKELTTSILKLNRDSDGASGLLSGMETDPADFNALLN